MCRLIPISDTELDSICRKALNYAKIHEPYYYDLFVVLYFTGIRINEIITIQNEYKENSDIISITPSKRNLNRLIDLNQKDNEFSLVDALRNSDYSLQQLKSAQRCFSRCLLNLKYVHDKKILTTYLLRHNYIKKKAKEINDTKNLQNLLGHILQDNTLNYVNSIIYLSQK